MIYGFRPLSGISISKCGSQFGRLHKYCFRPLSGISISKFVVCALIPDDYQPVSVPSRGYLYLNGHKMTYNEINEIAFPSPLGDIYI